MLNLMRRATALGLIAFILPLCALAADAGSYRLAGIVAVGPDYLGILQLPSGAQQLVRVGSTIEGGGRVVRVDAKQMRIQLPGRTLDLALDGSDAAPTVPVGLGVLTAQADMDNVMIRSVDADAFSDAAARSRNTAAAPAGSAAPAKRVDPGAEAGRRLAPILNLPPDSRIKAVNELPVRSADQAIKLIEQSLRDGIAPRLNIENAGGESRVYMSTPVP